VPQGAQFVSATPPPNEARDGRLAWMLDGLAPGEERVISVELLPLAEGELGSVADVSFRTRASASTICTRPQLVVEHMAPSRVLIGEQLKLAITISNPGSGAASGVLIEEDVPEGLSHAAGNKLEYQVGILAPGETRNLELTLQADGAGVVENVVRARGEGNLTAEHRVAIEVVAPQLQVGITGPSKRYLDRQVTYEVQVANPGTAPAKNVELVTYLPNGLKFVSTDNQGQYDPQRHAVYWSLTELPATKSGAVTLTALPVETGEQKLRVEGRADLGLANDSEHVVAVDGLAELFFTIVDVADPIEVGSETAYEIRLTNHGSKTDTNVQLTAQLPDELAPVSGEGPAHATVNGQQVQFQPIARLAPGEEAIYRIAARGARAGNSLVRVQVESDELATPVSKEEHTRVYSDQ
jgi:uncharacterized repeat protein (TIGR01451 family)